MLFKQSVPSATTTTTTTTTNRTNRTAETTTTASLLEGGNTATSQASVNEYGEPIHPAAVYPEGIMMIGILVALCLSMFFISLDQTILATAIPRITDRFNSILDIGSYGSAYFLAIASFQPIFGKIYKIFNIKGTFLVMIVVFELASLVSGLARSSSMLILGRAIAGFGFSGVLSGVNIISAYSVPFPRRPLVFAILGGVWALSSILAPILGGVLTDHVSWRWCFFINIPFGLLAAVVTIFFVRIPQYKKRSGPSKWRKFQQLDLFGPATLFPSVTCLLLALRWVGSTYTWYNFRIIGLLLGFVCLASLFALSQVKLKDYATLPPRILSQKHFIASLCFNGFFSAAIFTLTFFLPLYFQTVNGVSALTSGVETLPRLISAVLATIVGGAIVSWVRYYTPSFVTGALLVCVGSGLLSGCNVDTPFPKILGFQLLIGVGEGIAMQIPVIAVRTALSPDDVSVGMACVMFFRAIGATVFVSVGQSLFLNGILRGIGEFAPKVDPHVLLAAGATEIKSVLEGIGLGSELPGVLRAYMVGLKDSFRLIVACSCVAVIAGCFVEWTSVDNIGVDEEERPAEELLQVPLRSTDSDSSNL